MLDQPARIQAWLEDLAAINAEIEVNGMPDPRPAVSQRNRKLQPFWEE